MRPLLALLVLAAAARAADPPSAPVSIWDADPPSVARDPVPRPMPARPQPGPAVVVLPRVYPSQPAAAHGGAGLHTHKCPRCGTVWDHSTNPSHNCPRCGTYQAVVHSFGAAPRPAPAFLISPANAAPGGCVGGNCPAPVRRW